jgi:hypothetical protein
MVDVIDHVALAGLIETGTQFTMSKFASQHKEIFESCGFVNNKGILDHKKIADYYRNSYVGILKSNDKDKDKETGKALMALSYQASSIQKLREIWTSAQSHFITLMNVYDKTSVPPDTFSGDCELVGSHAWGIAERTKFSVSNAADTPARKLLEWLSECKGCYILPDGVVSDNLPIELRCQIKDAEIVVQGSSTNVKSLKAASTPQLLIPIQGQN